MPRCIALLELIIQLTNLKGNGLMFCICVGTVFF